MRSKWRNCGLWHTGWHLFGDRSVDASAPPKYKQTHKHTHTYEAIELAHSLRWNKTVPLAENSTTEGKKPAVLIGIPSSWSSWIQTLSHSELTQGNGKKTREGESESNREYIFDCSQKSWPIISSFSSSSSADHSCLCGRTLITKPFYGGQTESHQIKEERKQQRVWSLKFPEWLIPRRSLEWIA